MLHIPSVHTYDVSKHIPQEKNFPSGWKCYKTIGSYVSCAFIKTWSTWEAWRALKKLGLHLSCSPNFPRASYLDERTLTYEPIVNYEYRNLSFLSFGPGRQMCAVPCCCMNVHAMKLSANLLIKDAYVVLIIF